MINFKAYAHTPSVRRPIARLAPIARAALFALLLVITTPTPAAAPVLPEITIQAQREAIKPRVHRFVYDSLSLYEDEMPVRWNTPVCPAIIGLSRDKAEFMLARLSQIARTEGVPLGGERCSPVNLTVTATDRPEVFLRKWAKKRHWRMFSNDNPRAIDRFIATPRPVRVWYNSTYAPTAGTSQLAASQMPGVYTGSQNLNAPASVSSGGASRITRLQMRSFASVILVIDENQVQGVQLGSLTDYIAMNAFAQLNPASEPGDAPTILGLFQTSAAHGASGLTRWDEALLEALYHTNPTLVMQRSIMVTRMVSHLIPEETAP